MPPRKKRRTNKTNVRGKSSRCGAIAASKGNGRSATGLVEMPLDVLVEVFSLLHPQDLVNLSWTSKDFRAFLMNRGSLPFWRAARKQVHGLPDCPPFLSEPAYANLVFFTHCHGCAKAQAQDVIWVFAARYCTRCKAEQLVKTSSVLDFVESITHGLHYQILSKYSRFFYHRPEVDRIRMTWQMGFSNDAERTVFLERTKQDVLSRQAFASTMSKWVHDEEERKLRELEMLQNDRVREVEQRLRNEGWGQVLDWHWGAALNIIKGMKCVCKAEKLTDHAWRTIRKDIMKVVEEYRVYRLYAQRAIDMQPRLETLSQVVAGWVRAQGTRAVATDWHPHFADLALSSAFRKFIDGPANTEVEKDSLSKLQAQIPDLVAAWYVERKAEIKAIVVDALDSVAVDVDPLSLAVATFDCRHCSYRGMRWSQILAHSCARRQRMREPFTTADNLHMQAIMMACNRLQETHMWDSKAIIFNPYLERTRLAIKACAKDPGTATYEEMERCRVRVVCIECPRRCEALNWKMAGCHGLIESSWSPKTLQQTHLPSFEILNAEDTAKAHELESSQQAQANHSSLHTVYGCCRCRHRGTLSDLDKHCSSEHEIDTIEIGVDYYLHTDNRPRVPTPIRIYRQGLRQAVLDTIGETLEAKAAFVSSHM